MADDYEISYRVVRVERGSRGGYKRLDPTALKQQYLWLAQHASPEAEGLLGFLDDIFRQVGDDWTPPEPTDPPDPAAEPVARHLDL